ncbi:HNH endonuclease [Thalassobius sp. I31.1]|uniref:HNH endonuclease n=1 Tax=Thalassobius sp. I31.1 TaxID=2109912 RepID=UPI000D1AD1B2|nr:HNH endonuclease [Thalassobius sp. I31.1]
MTQKQSIETYKGPTREEIEAKISSNGLGATRDVLAGWGVPWPPPKGWKKLLLARADEAMGVVVPTKQPDRKTATELFPEHPAAFYTTAKWRKLRFEVLSGEDAKCACCGWFVGADQSANYLVVDHIVSRKLRPDLEMERGNLQILCNECNLGKGRFKKTDFRHRRE